MCARNIAFIYTYVKLSMRLCFITENIGQIAYNSFSYCMAYNNESDKYILFKIFNNQLDNQCFYMLFHSFIIFGN